MGNGHACTWAMGMHAHGHGQWACTGMGMGSSLSSRSLINHVDLVQTTWALGSNSIPDRSH